MTPIASRLQEEGQLPCMDSTKAHDRAATPQPTIALTPGLYDLHLDQSGEFPESDLSCFGSLDRSQNKADLCLTQTPPRADSLRPVASKAQSLR